MILHLKLHKVLLLAPSEVPRGCDGHLGWPKPSVIDQLLHCQLANIITTVNPQNYMGINFRESAQYSYSASKNFAVWWLKSKSTNVIN